MTKGGWRGGGRPEGSTSRKPTRKIIKQVRWTEAEWAEVELLAEEAGMTASDYIRRATLGRGQTVYDNTEDSKADLSAGLAANPIVKQTHQIMVGRLKSGNFFLQVDCVKVEIEHDMVDDLVAALLMAKGA